MEENGALEKRDIWYLRTLLICAGSVYFIAIVWLISMFKK